MASGPLRGIRVLELCTGVAGPLAGMLLADLGADVVKLEITPGDRDRGSAAFHVLNRSKRGVALAAPGDAAELVPSADVLLIDREQVRDAGGALDAEHLRSRTPALLHCTVSGFGERGPLADLPADDGLAAAAAAISALQWSHAGGPIYLRTPLTAYACGMTAALGVAAALYARVAGISAAGQAIATSQLGAGLLFQSGTYVVGPKHSGSIVQMANDPRGAIPSYAFYRASDDWLFVGALTDAFWVKLCTAIERPDLLAHPDLQVTPLAFVVPQRRAIVRAALEEVFAARPRAEWLALLFEHDVPCAPVQDRSTFLRDPQTRAAGMVATVDDPLLGPTTQLGIALSFGGSPGAIQGPAPRFDEHGERVRAEWRAARLDGASPPEAISGGTANAAPQAASRSTVSAGRETARPRSWSDDPAHPRNRARAALPPAPLDGVRVLSLATFIAGALCPMLLADLGAEVIKLEPLDGDPFRVGTTFGFLGWNRGTRSLALDLRRAEGLDVFFDLVRRADVLVDNYRPGVLARLRIDRGALEAANPRLIHTSITGYGSVGPLAERPCFDPIMQARSGLVRAQGGEEPVFHQIAYTDYSTATLAAFATVAALAARGAHPGRGERVEASLLGSALLMQAGAFIEWPGRPAEPAGEPALRGTSPTHRAYAARDGWIFVAAQAADERERLAGALDASELCESALAQRIAEMSRDEALAALREHRVPAVACAGFPEITSDSHLIANRLWWDSTHPELGEIRQTGCVIALSETPMRLGPVAPGIGEHTRELLLEAGFEAQRIDELIDTGVARA